MKQLKAFVETCQHVGDRIPTWTQGPGGNLSYKENGRLWIKASGFRLDAVTETTGIGVLDLDRFNDALSAVLSTGSSDTSDEKYSEAIRTSSLLEVSPHRPSMESGFHALLSGAWVLHFHSLPAVLMAHENRIDPQRLDAWLKNQAPLKVSFLPWLLPGYELCAALKDHGDASVFVLKNHGVILQGEEPLTEPTSTLTQWAQVEQAFLRDFGYPGVVEEEADNKLGPECLKAYFPDSLVFRDRLIDWYENQDTGAAGSPDIRELATAAHLLHRVCPTLEEVPFEDLPRLVAMPTEKHRRKLI